MSKNGSRLVRIIVTAALFAACIATFHFVELPENLWWAELVVYIAVFAVIAYDIVVKAVKGIIHGQIFDENLLMLIAAVGAMAVGEYPESILVMWLYQIGELFQSYALGRSRRSIGSLMDIRPDTARVIRDGEETVVSPDEVKVGESVVVLVGEKIPLDGVVTSGSSSLNTAALTGESLPRSVKEGSSVMSGCINLSGRIVMRAEKEFYDSTASKILDLVENASSRKAKAENFITKFARYYTPAVVVAALLLAAVPSIISALAPSLGMDGWQTWIYRAASFLIASCPCALVISVPLAFFGGIGGASAGGVLVKGGNYLELLAKADTFVMDKTGTVTKGVFEVQSVFPEEKREEILSLAATAESGSTHPIALSILRAAPKPDISGFSIEEAAGGGVRAVKGEERIEVGSEKFIRSCGVGFEPVQAEGTLVYVAENGRYVGALALGDEIKEGSAEAVAALKAVGCRVCMLTGDNEITARSVAEKVGMDEVHSSLLPAGKVEKLEQILNGKKKGSAVAFVGDGINDAPVLMRADIGVAMGALGSDSAIEAADVVLMHDDLRAIPSVIKTAKRTRAICLQNIIFSLAVKAAVLILSAFGIADAWLAIFADVGVMVLAVLNSMRCLKRTKPYKPVPVQATEHL